MAQPTITLPTGSGVNTPASVSTAVNTALAAETTFIGTQGLTALAPGVEDPTNAQGLGAPAIIRGTIYAHMCSGVTLGAGQTTAVQTATFNALQLAIHTAMTLGKFFEIEPNVYEIYGSTGLVVPATLGAITWKGSRQSNINQFYANAPILVLGDSTGAETLYGNKIDGFCLNYGVSQTGNTNAIALLMGDMAWCVVENFETTTNGTFPIINPPYVSVSTIAAGTWFNNCLRNIRLYGGQLSLMVIQASGSGNLFQDIYMSNGGNISAEESYYAALSGPALSLANPSYSGLGGNVFERINIESVKCSNSVIYAQIAGVTQFIGLHFENLELNASGGSLINNNGCQLILQCVDTYDIQVDASLTDISFLYNNGSGEVVLLDGLHMGWSSNSNPGLKSPMTIIGTGGNNDQNNMVRIKGVTVNDDTGNNSTNLTVYNGAYPMTYTETADTILLELDADQISLSTSRYQPCITTATYTHYGCHEDAVLMVPSSLAAACVITLSNKRIASGLGSSLATKTGNTVRVRRISGTYANTLTIKDAQSGSTLVTNSAAGNDYLFTFNGTNWVAAA
jgi:hypothetical protein